DATRRLQLLAQIIYVAPAYFLERQNGDAAPVEHGLEARFPVSLLPVVILLIDLAAVDDRFLKRPAERLDEVIPAFQRSHRVVGSCSKQRRQSAEFLSHAICSRTLDDDVVAIIGSLVHVPTRSIPGRARTAHRSRC